MPTLTVFSFFFSQIDQLKQELSKKESELLALQTKLETLTNQNSDCKQHIEVLKESLTAKEQRSAILQTEASVADRTQNCPALLFSDEAMPSINKTNTDIFFGASEGSLR